MSWLNPLQDDEKREQLDRKVLDWRQRGLEQRAAKLRVVETRQGIRVGRARVRPDTPSHTPGTNRGEEWALHATEQGRVGWSRQARSATAINPTLHDAVDHRMPHLPPA